MTPVMTPPHSFSHLHPTSERAQTTAYTPNVQPRSALGSEIRRQTPPAPAFCLKGCAEHGSTRRDTSAGHWRHLGHRRSIVERFRSEGAAVVCTGRNETRGCKVAARTGARFIRSDVREPEAVRAAVDTAVATLGGLDALVANAGVLHKARLSETTDVAWDAVLETNVVGYYLYAVACLPHLRQAGGGSITMISSDAGVCGERRSVQIGIQANGQHLVNTLAVEAGPHGMRVNAVCPGDTAPGMVTNVAGRGEATDPRGWTLPPLARVGTGADVQAP